MCGVTGFWSDKSINAARANEWLDHMTATLAHRGPDDVGTFVDGDQRLAFGQRRLSILDLSKQGHQPMWSHSRRFCIAYNGEVYNAPELRTELADVGTRIPWRGHSDTETVLEAIEAFGLEEALGRFVGMFAFSLWDAKRGSLFLARDRLGIKPLSYARGAFGVAFGSELRALLRFPPFEAKLDRQTLAGFLRYGVVPGTASIVQGARKVPAGAILEFKEACAEPRRRDYWSAYDVATRGLENRFPGTAQDAVEELERLLDASVKVRMRSDVPFGAFLSGGIDSSTVAAFMQRNSSVAVHTFCIGNEADGYDESRAAEAVASHLGCTHRTLVADPSEALGLVPQLGALFDEPFADSSQIPTYLVSKLARKHVTVALSGDGGDELFGGYNRHVWAPRLWRWAERLPTGARKRLGLLRQTRVGAVDQWANRLGLGGLVRLPGDKLHKVALLADASTPEEFYERLRSHWHEPERLVQGLEGSSPEPQRDLEGDFSERIMLQDLIDYLPDDILTKVDRASMAVSLEARVPLLDHRIVEFAWSLPLQWKVHGGTGKWILRHVLERHVPTELFDRPKTGFGVPVGEWLRGPLREWAADLLGDELDRSGILEPTLVRDTWNAHLAESGNHEHQLWAVLMFQSWWEENRQWVEA